MVLYILRSKKFSKRVLIALLILIIPAFFLWGIDSFKNRPEIVGEIGSRKIFLDDYTRSMQGTRIQFIMSLALNSSSMEQLMNNRTLINMMAWERLMLLNSAEKERIKISDKEVMTFLMTHPLFQNNGKFNPDTYEYLVRNSFSMDSRQFEELLRENLKVKELRRRIFKEISVSDNDIRNLFLLENGKVDLSYILVSKNSFSKDTIITNEEAESYYNANPEEFYSQEKAEAEYISIPFKDKSEKEKVIFTLKNLYPELKKSPEQFSQIADTYSLSHGDTGSFSKNSELQGLPSSQDIYDSAFSLKTGEISSPIFYGQDNGAIYILHKTASISPEKLDFNKVKDSIITSLVKTASLVKAKDEALKIYSSIKENNISLEDSAKKMGLEIKKVSGINSKDSVENIGNAHELVTLAYKEGVGNIIPPVSTQEGSIIVQVDFIYPIDNKEFDNKKENIHQRLISEKQSQALETWLKEHSKDVKLKKDLSQN